MHVAHALNTKSIIIYGGRETPENSGYEKKNINLINPIECSPCWIHTTEGEICPYNNKCLKEITPETVLAKVKISFACKFMNNNLIALILDSIPTDILGGSKLKEQLTRIMDCSGCKWTKLQKWNENVCRFRKSFGKVFVAGLLPETNS